MRVRTGLALLLALAPLTASAQFLTAPEPIRPDRSPLAMTAEVPEVFHLFAGHEAPVFVNPARGARHDPFVYATVRDAFSLGPLSAAALLGEGRTRWLVQAEHFLFNAASASTDEIVQSPDPDVFSRRLSTRDRDDDLWTTRGRAALVRKTDFGGYSVGVFGGYRREQREELFAAERELRQTSNFGSGQETFTETFADEDRSLDRLDSYAVGAEVGLAGRRWDLVLAASYQSAAGENTRASLDDDETLLVRTGSFPFRRLTERTSTGKGRLDGGLGGVDVEAVGAVRAGRAGRLWGRLGGTFSGGEGDVEATASSRFFERVTQSSETSTFEERDSSGGAAESDLGSAEYEAALAYVHAYEARWLRVLAALVPSFSYATRDGVGTVLSGEGDTEARAVSEETLAAGVALPLHFRGQMTRRLELFGGGAFGYQYGRFEQREDPLLLGGDAPDLPGGVREAGTESSSLSTRASYYIGAVYEASGDLVLQAAFFGDFAAFGSWTISAGYRF